jgi:Flp pilus assembly protein TadG
MRSRRMDDALKLLARLLRDKAGNTLMIVAASIIPIIAVIGGAIDMSRAYMVHSQLYQACDAAALAGRRTMNGDPDRNTDIANVKAEALKYFNFNFPTGKYGAPPITPTITPVYSVPFTVNVSASTPLPTYIMQIFGYQTIPVGVSCSATQNYNNIDIMLVLDITGSMANNSTSDGILRITALKNAAKALYNQLQGAKTAMESATPTPLKLRIGVVSYNNTVNVGKLLYASKNSYIKTGLTDYYTSSNYTWNSSQSKWSNTSAADRFLHVDVTGYVNAGIADTTRSNAYAWAGCIEEQSTDGTITGTQSTTTVPSNALDIQMTPTSMNWAPFLVLPQDGFVTTSGVSAQSSNSYAPPPTNANVQIRNTFFPSGYYNGSTLSGHTGVAPTSTTASYASTTGNGPNYNCPQQALPLGVYSETDFDNYIDSLTTGGSTLHDVGMIWGLRMISPNAPFNISLPTNNYPLNRFVIFMSDGFMGGGLSYSNGTQATEGGVYSSWGVEAGSDRRVNGSFSTSSSDNVDARHTTRFLMACNQAKSFIDSQNNPLIQIFTIALGTSSMPDSMQKCASSTDQAYITNNGNDLKSVFQQIAEKIGKLRLSQ